MNRQAYTQELFAILNSLPDSKRAEFAAAFGAVEKNPVILFGLNAYLGFLGIDRFVVGDILAGVLKLITGGGFGLWVLIDLFLIGGRARTKNIIAARQLKASLSGLME